MCCYVCLCDLAIAAFMADMAFTDPNTLYPVVMTAVMLFDSNTTHVWQTTTALTIGNGTTGILYSNSTPPVNQDYSPDTLSVSMYNDTSGENGVDGLVVEIN